MLNERLAVAKDVANKIAEAEAAIDHAIAATGALLNFLPLAQSTAKLSPVVGNTAYSHMQTAVAGLFSARAGMVEFHHELDQVKNHIGLRRFRIRGTGDAAKILEPTALNDETTDGATNARAA